VQNCTSGATTNITITDVNIRNIVCQFNAGDANATNTVVNITLPAASAYTPGVAVNFMTTATIPGPGGLGTYVKTLTVRSPGSTLSASNMNAVSIAAATVVPGSGYVQLKLLTDGVSKWFWVEY
jgi:hypothetical protein